MSKKQFIRAPLLLILMCFTVLTAQIYKANAQLPSPTPSPMSTQTPTPTPKPYIAIQPQPPLPTKTLSDNSTGTMASIEINGNQIPTGAIYAGAIIFVIVSVTLVIRKKQENSQPSIYST